MKNLSFKLFLERTISDYLSSLENIIKPIKLKVRNHLQNYLSGRDLEVAINLFTYIYQNEKEGNIKDDWEKFKDYLSVSLSHNRTTFVNPITRSQLEDLNDKYHIELKISNKNLRKGPKGDELVDVSKELSELNKVLPLPSNFKPSLWSGWKWVSLGCGSSNQEGSAAGHCGNSSNKSGDNIFSLRNPNSQVLLTFIVNVEDGALGESKGLNNEKPNKNLHPAIVALLSSNYVKTIKGGGYIPENNFNIEDLSYNKKLYEYFLNNLKGDKVHSKPENYLPLSWLTSLNDEIIHVKYHTPEQKLELLEKILNTFNNYRVFDLEEEGGADNENPSPKLFKPIPFKLDLNKLIRDCLNAPEANNPKYLIDILSKVTAIYSSNRVWDDFYLDKFRPDLINVDLPKDSEGTFLTYIKKMKNINIDDQTINYILEKILSKKLNLRDKSKTLNLLTKASGYGHSELPQDSEFVKVSNSLMNNILEDCLALKEVPKFIGDDIVDYLIKHIDKDKLIGKSLYFNYKKQLIEFAVHIVSLRYSDDKKEYKEFLKKFEENFLLIKSNFIKKGIPVNNGSVKNMLNRCAADKFNDDFFNRLEKTLVTNYGFFKAKNNRSTIRPLGYIKKVVDVKKILKDTMAGKPIDLIDNIDKDIGVCRQNLINKMIKNIKSWIKDNFDNLYQCVRKTIDASKENLFYKPTPRHQKKSRVESPEQLSRERRATKQYIRDKEHQKALQDYESARNQKIKDMAQQLLNRNADKNEHRIYFKEFIN